MSTRPPETASKPSTAGIVQDAVSQQRIIPESRRADGSIRKERKVRPGFTPVEDVARFRSSRRRQAEEGGLSQDSSTSKTDLTTPSASALPKNKVSPNPPTKPVFVPAPAPAPEKKVWAGSRLRKATTQAPSTGTAAVSVAQQDSKAAGAQDSKDTDTPKAMSASEVDSTEALLSQIDSLRISNKGQHVSQS